MKRFLLFPLAALALSGCIDFPDPRYPQNGPPPQVSDSEQACPMSQTRVYRPIPDGKAPYDATIPPTYNTPSQLPLRCAET